MLFTSANAKQMSDKAVEAKRLRRLEMQAVVNAPEPTITVAAKPSVDPRVQKLGKLIDRTLLSYERARKARDAQAWAMALDRLLGSWSLLTGHPRPGVRRVTKDSNRAPGPAFTPQDHEDPPSPEPL